MSHSQKKKPKKLRAWVQASRLPSLSYILLPLALGQLFAFYKTGLWSEFIFFASLFYGAFLQLFIVYANDVADYETDCLNESATLFSGGSRVLVQKLLSREELKYGAFVMLLLLVGVAFYLTYLTAEMFVLPLALLGPIFLWMYSYRPFRLSYRGGGEVLQALGLASVLPFLGFLLQRGASFSEFFYLSLVLFPSQLSCAMSTGVPDAISDSMSRKNTFVVTLGPYKSCVLITALHTLSYLFLVLFLEQGLFFSGIAYSLKAILLPQFILTALLLHSFYKRNVKDFVFFSISLVFYLIGYLIFLSL